jgi:polar amino acid transport system substrate-binding protein
MRSVRLAGLITALALLGAACGAGTTGGGDGGGGGVSSAKGGDLLAQVKERGKLTASTDPAYPPQSFQTPGGELKGFDIDVTQEIAKRLGVEVQYVTPSFDAITAGSWSGRWDISVGSITITPERQKALLFTPPYYYTPASVAVHEDNTDITNLATDLDGKKIGVCQACSYEFYLKKNLTLPGEKVKYVVDDAQVRVYDTDTTAIQDLGVGDGVRLDAVMSALPTLQQAIKNDTPIKIVGQPLFYEPLAVAIDKSAPADPKRFYEKVSQIVTAMHQDGTLTELSKKWYEGTDLTKKQ